MIATSFQNRYQLYQSGIFLAIWKEKKKKLIPDALNPSPCIFLKYDNPDYFQNSQSALFCSVYSKIAVLMKGSIWVAQIPCQMQPFKLVLYKSTHMHTHKHTHDRNVVLTPQLEPNPYTQVQPVQLSLIKIWKQLTFQRVKVDYNIFGNVKYSISGLLWDSRFYWIIFQ